MPLQIRKLFPRPLFLLSTTIVCCTLGRPAAAADGWIAYNDCVDTSPGDTPVHATNFGLGRSYQGDGSSGNLLDFETGEDTGVTVTFTENTSAGNTINWASDFADFTPDTDAQQIFGGILNLSGNMSYNDAPGWSLDLTFTNLDPSGSYTFAATVNRNGGDSYRDRITNWMIMGAAASTYASSEAAHKVNEQSVEFITGHNPEGLVARWTDIRPAADGSFTIRTSHGIGAANGGLPGENPFRGYAGGLFMLMAQAGPGRPLDLLEISHDAAADTTELTWSSQAGEFFDIRKSLDLTADPGAWPLLTSQISAAPAPAETTTLLVDTNATESTAFYKVFKVLPPPLFEDDFETDRGWTSGVDDGNGNTTWQRGAPSGVGPTSGAGGSATCFGTNLSSDYGLEANVWLRSPSIDLSGPGITGVRLSFQHFPLIEQAFDAGSIRVLRASDGVPLGAPIATGIDESSFTSDWSPFSAILPPEAIGESIQLEFRFQSDDLNNLAGWYLDDLVLTRR